MPFGWERRIVEDNKVPFSFQMNRYHPTTHCKQVVYVDLVNKKTTFTDPRLAFAKETVSATTTFRQKFDSGSTALQVLESTYSVIKH